MTHLRSLLLFLLALISLTSSKNAQSLDKVFSVQSPPYKLKNKSLTDSPIDLHYLDGCTAILKGFDDVLSDSHSYSYYFAEWENAKPDRTFLDYFDNNKGLISKIFVSNDSGSDDTWIFHLLIYDGISINKKVAKVQIKIDNVQNNTTIDQTAGTFTTNDSIMLTVYFGENFETKYQTDITGQVAISFMNAATNQPFSSFDRRASSVKGNSFQLSFTSSDGSFSFKTSTFASSFMTTADNLITAAFVVVSLLVGLSTWYTKDLNKKVIFWNVPAFSASATYIILWSFIEPQYKGLSYWILAIPPVVNFAKCIFWTIKRMIADDDDGSTSRFAILMASSIMTFFLYFIITPVWMDLFPIFVLLLPFLYKIWTFEQNPHCLSRFEIMNYLSVLLWIGYAYLYPRNFYRFFNMALIYVSFGCILFQLICLFIMQRIISKRSNQHLLEDKSMNSNDQQANRSQTQDLEDTPTHHRYTLYAKIDEYHELLGKDCLCKKSLIGAKPQSLYKTPCEHVFHEECLRKYGAQRMKCPSCGKGLPKFETAKK